MPSGILRRFGEPSGAAHAQLPFTNNAVEETDFSHGPHDQTEPISSTLNIRNRPTRSASTASASHLSSSYTGKTPARSFAHHVSHAAIDAPQYASQGVRERTQELAAYALDAESFRESQSHKRAYTDSDTGSSRRTGYTSQGRYGSMGRRSFDSHATDAIEELSEPISPETIRPESYEESSQGYFEYLVQQPSNGYKHSKTSTSSLPDVFIQDADDERNTETSPLLPKSRFSSADTAGQHSQSSRTASFLLTLPVKESFVASRNHVVGFWHALSNPKNYTKDAAIHGALSSVQMLSAVFLGLLLNVLDALSYGYILFPLGVPKIGRASCRERVSQLV